MATPELSRTSSPSEWDEQVAELIEAGLLTEELEGALHAVAEIIAAEGPVWTHLQGHTTVTWPRCTPPPMLLRPLVRPPEPRPRIG